MINTICLRITDLMNFSGWIQDPGLNRHPFHPKKENLPMKKHRFFPATVSRILMAFFLVSASLPAFSGEKCLQAYERCYWTSGWSMEGYIFCLSGYIWCIVWVSE
jgi:hypothetical protein